MDERISHIRESEQKSHEAFYSRTPLYAPGSWLHRPIKTVRELVSFFDAYEALRVLDLGCGVGRNSIYLAQHFSHIHCQIDCVDILDIAVEKLLENAAQRGVASRIRGICTSIEAYRIPEDSYDWILAVSALEHMDTLPSFRRKLVEINRGLRSGGIVCLVMNSGAEEINGNTGETMEAEFELNFPTEHLQALLREAFEGWEVLKASVSAQEYDIPRETFSAHLHTRVVTYAARKPSCPQA